MVRVICSITSKLIPIYFISGDIVQHEENSYRILGRSSVDIIKSGGYKISALFVESVLLQNPNIRDVTVVGLPDPTWGQKVSKFLTIGKYELSSLFTE